MADVVGWPPRWLTPVPIEDQMRGDGELYANFAEAVCRVTKDSVASPAGKLLELRGWQKELLKHTLARREDGRFRHRTALVGMSRKNGKSALSSAAIGLYSLLGEGINGGEVIAVAATREQARIVFSEAKRMVENSELKDLVQVFRDSIFVPETNSVFKVMSAESWAAEGLNPSRVILDELHAQPNRELFDVMSLAMGNRGKIGQVVAITTAGVKSDASGQDSIAYSLYNYGKRVATGEIDDPAFFMAWWEAAPEADHREPTTWQSANPGFDDIVSAADFESAVRRTPEAEFRTKRLNQWVNTKTAWLPAGTWAELEEDFEMTADDEYVLGFDGSWNNDSTSLVAVILPRFEGDVFRVKRAASWEKDFAKDDDSWIVDKNEVTQFIFDFFTQYPKCREMPCDPSYWEDQMWLWQDFGLPVVEYRNSNNRTIPATAKLYDAIMNQQIKHDGDPALARHIDNCILKLDAGRGARITKDYRNPKLKIDNAIAMMMAYDRASGRIEEQVVPEFFV